MYRNLYRIMIFLAALWFAPAAWAAHPLITDDTGTQGAGRFQLEVNGQYDHDKEEAGGVTIKATGTSAAMALSYGLFETADLVVGMPYQWYTVKQDGAIIARASGISDVSVDVKWRFYENEGLSAAIRPGVRMPSGDDEKGLGAGKTGYGIYLIATSTHDHWMHHFNIGYVRNENRIDQRESLWHLSLATEYSLAEKTRVVANIGMDTNPDKTSEREPAFLLAGVIHSPSKDLDLDAGVKTGLNDAETDLSFLVGVTVRF